MLYTPQVTRIDAIAWQATIDRAIGVKRIVSDLTVVGLEIVAGRGMREKMNIKHKLKKWLTGDPTMSDATHITASAHGTFDDVVDWKSFLKVVRGNDIPLLKASDSFMDAIYVYGCPRSGTTITTRLISQAPGIVDVKNEFTSACILCGGLNHTPDDGRYCF